MTSVVFRRHNRENCASTNRYEPRCGCPLWVQFVWKGAPGVFQGKKLAYQNKWSLETRSFSEALSRVKELEKRLKDFADGKVVPKGVTAEAALQEWTSPRPERFGQCQGETDGRQTRGVVREQQHSAPHRLHHGQGHEVACALPHRSGDSSSLSVHWSVIGGFFSWPRVSSISKISDAEP